MSKKISSQSINMSDAVLVTKKDKSTNRMTLNQKEFLLMSSHLNFCIDCVKSRMNCGETFVKEDFISNLMNILRCHSTKPVKISNSYLARGINDYQISNETLNEEYVNQIKSNIDVYLNYISNKLLTETKVLIDQFINELVQIVQYSNNTIDFVIEKIWIYTRNNFKHLGKAVIIELAELFVIENKNSFQIIGDLMIFNMPKKVFNNWIERNILFLENKSR